MSFPPDCKVTSFPVANFDENNTVLIQITFLDTVFLHRLSFPL